MSLVLDLSPAEERRITEHAKREGLSVTEYAIRRLLQTSQDKPSRAQFDAVFAPIHAATRQLGESEAEIAAFAETLVKAHRTERRQSKP